eukprot:PhM_4_TR16528/c1_g1_i1/m.40430
MTESASDAIVRGVVHPQDAVSVCDRGKRVMWPLLPLAPLSVDLPYCDHNKDVVCGSVGMKGYDVYQLVQRVGERPHNGHLFLVAADTVLHVGHVHRLTPHWRLGVACRRLILFTECNNSDTAGRMSTTIAAKLQYEREVLAAMWYWPLRSHYTTPRVGFVDGSNTSDLVQLFGSDDAPLFPWTAEPVETTIAAGSIAVKSSSFAGELGQQLSASSMPPRSWYSDDRVFLFLGANGTGKRWTARRLCMSVINGFEEKMYTPVLLDADEALLQDGDIAQLPDVVCRYFNVHEDREQLLQSHLVVIVEVRPGSTFKTVLRETLARGGSNKRTLSDLLGLDAMPNTRLVMFCPYHFFEDGTSGLAICDVAAAPRVLYLRCPDATKRQALATRTLVHNHLDPDSAVRQVLENPIVAVNAFLMRSLIDVVADKYDVVPVPQIDEWTLHILRLRRHYQHTSFSSSSVWTDALAQAVLSVSSLPAESGTDNLRLWAVGRAYEFGTFLALHKCVNPHGTLSENNLLTAVQCIVPCALSDVLRADSHVEPSARLCLVEALF